jgi:hypothetical protein
MDPAAHLFSEKSGIQWNRVLLLMLQKDAVAVHCSDAPALERNVVRGFLAFCYSDRHGIFCLYAFCCNLVLGDK